MSIFDAAGSFFPRSVITRSELTYIERSSPRPGRWRSRLRRAFFLACITLSMILYWGEFAGALLQRDAAPIGEHLQPGAVLLMAVALVLHFGLMFQTLSLAANSIARERQNNTWDMLVLTGLDARQIVYGKWWAIVQRQWRNYAVLGLLRMGAIVWFSAAASRIFAYSYLYGGFWFMLPNPLHILIAGAAILALTLVNLGFTAACGVLASSQSERSALALVRAIILRVLTLLGVAALILAIPLLLWNIEPLRNIYQPVRALGVEQMLARSLATLFDNGASLAGELSTVRYSFYPDYTPPDMTILSCIAIFVSLALYLLMTRFLLGLAQRRAVREQALPPKVAITL
jgi:hypothetical protein